MDGRKNNTIVCECVVALLYYAGARSSIDGIIAQIRPDLIIQFMGEGS